MIASATFVVAPASNLIELLKIIFVISGSTITGVTEATEYFLRSVIILLFVDSVRLEPLVGKIEI